VGTEHRRVRPLTLHLPDRMGKSCLYVRRLADVDVSVLEQLIVGSVAAVLRTYG
jgi:hypothetical protein